MKQKIDFLAVGDTLTDAFIELIDANVHCNIDNDNCTISMPFGAKIPYKSVDVLRGVGNAANAAVAAGRLGLTSALIAIVGNDDEGAKTHEHFKSESVMTDFITTQDGVPTNYHYVLRYGAERTILVKHEHYEYKLDTEKLNQYEIEWVYLTSIASGTEKYHDELIDWLETRPEIKLAFQPGTFQMEGGIEPMKRVYARSNAFFCNKDEAQDILGITNGDYPELHAKLRELGPEIVCITDGPNGATISNPEHAWFIPMYPDPKPPVDRTGAGDSCSSTAVAAMLLGKDLPTSITYGVTNSMSVVQYIGAQAGLLSKEKIEEFLNNVPVDFQVKELW
jgi:sugar/nucleoside kinase (ribokinase family)